MDLRHPVPPEQLRAELTRKVETLRAAVAGATFDLETTNAPAARLERTALLRHLDDYVLPRLRRMDAPLLAVVGGSTGAGKSTLVNSLIRREVSRSGVLRPTTRSPVLVHHPHDSGAFLSQRILPGLGRVTSEAPEPMQPIDVDAPRITAIRLVPDDAVAPGLGILDAPDIDSVVDTNRDLAVQLLSAADLWVFVTTAARYADDLPWQLLGRAVERGAAVAIVLDRVPPDSLQQVRMHLATLLRDRGLASAPMFTLPETTLEDGFLPAELVQPLLTWLTALARDTNTRDLVANRTLTGAVASLPARAQTLGRWADEQNDAEAHLLLELDEAFRAANERVGARLEDGSLVRGEVLARWRDLVGTGELFSALEKGRARGRSLPPAGPLATAMYAAIGSTLRANALDAVRAAQARWWTAPAGPALLHPGGGDDLLEGLSAGFDDRLTRAVQEWAAEASTQVHRIARERDGSVRSDPNAKDGLGVLGALLAIGGTRGDDELALGRRVFGAMLGEERVPTLLAQLRVGLRGRLRGVLDHEEARFMELLDTPEARAVRGDKLRSVARAVKEGTTWR